MLNWNCLVNLVPVTQSDHPRYRDHRTGSFLSAPIRIEPITRATRTPSLGTIPPHGAILLLLASDSRPSSWAAWAQKTTRSPPLPPNSVSYRCWSHWAMGPRQRQLGLSAEQMCCSVDKLAWDYWGCCNRSWHHRQCVACGLVSRVGRRWWKGEHGCEDRRNWWRYPRLQFREMARRRQCQPCPISASRSQARRRQGRNRRHPSHSAPTRPSLERVGADYHSPKWRKPMRLWRLPTKPSQKDTREWRGTDRSGVGFRETRREEQLQHQHSPRSTQMRRCVAQIRRSGTRCRRVYRPHRQSEKDSGPNLPGSCSSGQSECANEGCGLNRWWGGNISGREMSMKTYLAGVYRRFLQAPSGQWWCDLQAHRPRHPLAPVLHPQPRILRHRKSARDFAQRWPHIQRLEGLWQRLVSLKVIKTCENAKIDLQTYKLIGAQGPWFPNASEALLLPLYCALVFPRGNLW